MSNDDYLSKYIDEVELSEATEAKDQKWPTWVDPSNHSAKAYDAIEKLKIEKLAYIKKHGKKSDYATQGNYLITKVEVAKLVGPDVKPQPLFRSRTTAYCSHLLKHFNDTNEDLKNLKVKRLSKSGRGLMQKTKGELVEQVRQEQESNSERFSSLVDDLYTKTLDNLSIDIKRKLGLL
ncbi:MAG: hypothetical protein ACPG5R_04125 [Cognaticolwellia aestuarii]